MRLRRWVIGGPDVPAILHARLEFEASKTVRVAIHAACYRLGVSGALGEILATFATMDRDLADNVMNRWGDLTDRRLAPTLDDDAAVIMSALRLAADKFPHRREQAELIARRLAVRLAATPGRAIDHR